MGEVSAYHKVTRSKPRHEPDIKEEAVEIEFPEHLAPTADEYPVKVGNRVARKLSLGGYNAEFKFEMYDSEWVIEPYVSPAKIAEAVKWVGDTVNDLVNRDCNEVIDAITGGGQ